MRMPTFYYYGRRKGGHAPGHIRDAFRDAMFAFMDWDRVEPEPTVEVEIHYQPRTMTISQVCGLLWNCSDILNGQHADWIAEHCGLENMRNSYAAAARAMHKAVRETQPARAELVRNQAGEGGL
jgi:hypothetical protein